MKLMKIVVCLAFLFVGLSAQQCKQDVNPELLYQQWVHLHEEDANDVEVYRTKAYNFPVARGRTGFEFKKDGTFIQSDIGPVDINVNTTGKWEKVPGQNEVKISLDNDEHTSYRMEIVELKKDLLKARRIESK